MTREEAIYEIEKVFEPAFANYIITALTEGATSSDKEQQPCEGMRDATEEERKSTHDYIDSISKPIGFSFDEAYEEIEFVETHKKLSANLQLCNDCVSREAAKASIQRKIDELVNEDGSYDCDIKPYINGLFTAKIAISSYNLPSVTPIKKDDLDEKMKEYKLGFQDGYVAGSKQSCEEREKGECPYYAG